MNKSDKSYKKLTSTAKAATYRFVYLKVHIW